MQNISTKRILITGALGYLGSETLRIVKECARDVLAIDKLDGASSSVQSLDLKDVAKTSQVIINFKPDAIIHFATHSALAYKNDFLHSFQEDFSATLNVLNALASMPDCRLIYFSSSYVYSGLPQSQNYDESSPLTPKHNFGIAKSFLNNLF